jgi:hypothetical protein
VTLISHGVLGRILKINTTTGFSLASIGQQAANAQFVD